VFVGEAPAMELSVLADRIWFSLLVGSKTAATAPLSVIVVTIFPAFCPGAFWEPLGMTPQAAVKAVAQRINVQRTHWSV